jgi:hypothetical protein
MNPFLYVYNIGKGGADNGGTLHGWSYSELSSFKHVEASGNISFADLDA